MNKDSWKRFTETRKQFKKIAEDLDKSLPKLKNIQQKFVNSRSETTYKIETPVVYNSALDDITIDDEIKLILVADNPGRREQSAENRRYLVGPSGKIAKKFFIDTPALGIDYTKNVIILNKTPIHSPRTVELRELCRMDSSLICALDESQKNMAAVLLNFHETLKCPVWITGYSEMRKGGIFEVYTEELKKLYADKKEMYNNLFIFRHFSMNQFTIDLKKQALPKESAAKSLIRIGTAYRKRILG